MFFVTIRNGRIVGKGCGPGLSEGQVEVSEDVYRRITSLPMTFTVDKSGNITDVSPLSCAVESESIDYTNSQRLQHLEQALAELSSIVASINVGKS